MSDNVRRFGLTAVIVLAVVILSVWPILLAILLVGGIVLWLPGADNLDNKLAWIFLAVVFAWGVIPPMRNWIRKRSLPDRDQ